MIFAPKSPNQLDHPICLPLWGWGADLVVKKQKVRKTAQVGVGKKRAELKRT